jgi:hypothetical protein
MPILQGWIRYCVWTHGIYFYLNIRERNQFSYRMARISAYNGQIHLESGTCSNSGLDRHKINNIIQRMDRNHIITHPMLTMADNNHYETMATERAWNGEAYECYFCPREFASLRSLNAHMNSPVHEQHIYKCPKAGCGRNYKLLSGLVQHVESESCGIMRFENVQKQAQNGIQVMVGRLITG